MQNIILLPILCVLIGWLIHIRYKEVNQKRAKFAIEYSSFTNNFLGFIEDLENKTVSLNASILSEFPQHSRAKNAFVHNMRGFRLKRFNEKWAEYEKEYNTVNNQGIFTRFAAFAPSQEALEKATHLDAEQWEIDRKENIHHIITQLLEISERNIWF